MKRNDYTEYTKGQEVSGVTFEQHQNQVIESINSVMLALGLDTTQVTILWGIEECGLNPECTVSAGAVFYNGEIFEVDAYTGASGFYPTAYFLRPVTRSIGDDISFISDGSTKAVHLDHKYEIAFGSDGSPGEVSLSGLNRISDLLLTYTGAKGYTDQEIASLQTEIDALKDADAKVPVDNSSHHGIITRYYPEANLRHITSSGTVSNLGTYPKSKLTITNGETRYIKYICGLSLRREGSDNDRVRIKFEYSLNNGASWNTGKIYEAFATSELIPISLFDYLPITSTPAFDLRFRLNYELLDLSIYVPNDDDIDIMLFQ